MKDNKILETKEKLAKAEEKLNVLLEQKKALDNKITNAKNEIEKYTNIINQQTFNELTEVLTVKGVSIDELMSAIKSGNLGSINLSNPVSVNSTEIKENEVGNTNSSIGNN